ncbi:MAG: hypothetical protein Q9162_002894 [Coniocarpon cinnabarinum]
MASSTAPLTEPQLQALYDILTHDEVYAEIQDFRSPRALENYGPPFGQSSKEPSHYPSLQTLVSRFLVPLPGLKNVPQSFWNDQVAPLIETLEEAELSESYDKGTLGIRKTLATAISALVEYPVRGVFGGFDPPPASWADEKKYDLNNAADLERAFKDLMLQAVYGSALDDMFAKTARTDKIEDHTPEVQAAHEYILVNLASFMHYTLIKSPKGQQLLGLIDHINKLLPYTMIRQTLKIGNVASMISAMVKVTLAKMSVASVTNWMGFTQGSDEGMNLMQNITSTVLHWDIRQFKNRVNQIEKSKDAPTKAQLHTVKNYLFKSRAEHEALRERSFQNSESIVHVILKNNGSSTHMSRKSHALLLEYLTMKLSGRDRDQLNRILCHSNPDHLTQAVREMVSAYEPVIRSVHNAVDLSETLYDFEIFLRDMIKLSKLPSDPDKRAQAHIPTVGDFIQLLKKHMRASHKFMHACAKNGPEVTKWFQDYAKHAVAQFRRRSDNETIGGAGDLSTPLQDMWKSLQTSQQKQLVNILDAHSQYLVKLHAASRERLRTVIMSPTTNHPVLKGTGSAPGSRSSSPAPTRLHHKQSEPKMTGKKNERETQGEGDVAGPGAYLARWQHLLDATWITPGEATGGHVRGGGFKSVVNASGTTVESDETLQPTDSESSSIAAKSDYDDQRNDATEDSTHDGEGQSRQAQNEVDEDVFEDARERLDALGLSGDEKKKQDDLRVDIQPVIEALGKQFRELLAQRSIET